MTNRDETTVGNAVRLAAAYQGLQLWRNNTGVAVDLNGRHIRYGLANDSKQLNDRIKSSDFIGITPYLVMPHDVGRIVGVFTALETKREDWHMTPGDKRAVAQAAFHDIVRQAGGFAGFVQSTDDMMRIIGR